MSYTAALRSDLGGCARTVQLADGDVLVRQGDEADEVFLVESGAIDAVNTTEHGDFVVGTIGPGQVIGEVTVIAGGRRTATLRSVGPSEVLVIERADFERWLADNDEIADAVSTQARERIDRTQVAAVVTGMFGSADARLVQDIVDRVEWRHLEAGDVLFEQGDPSDAAYFIVGGRVLVSVRTETGEQPIGELGRGEVVGELGLLDTAPRSATVRAVRDTTLAAFRAQSFEALVSTSPAVMLHVARGIMTRMNDSPRGALGRATSLTVAITAPVEPERYVEAIVREVANFGSTRHLSSSRVDRYLNRPDISQAAADNVGLPRLAEFMHEADVGNDHVVLETDRELTGWTRRALRQADRVLVIASADPDGEERARIHELFDAIGDFDHVSTMLGILHPHDRSRPSGTARLIDEFGVGDVVHLRSGSDADLARLARLATGHGVGLVLSGGGARGFAHIGVYRALREAGVPVDQVAGCSMGAPIAGGIARGIADDDLVAVAERLFHRLLDYTLPVVSLIKGRRVTASIEETFGGWDIEDLWLPYYCVSTNLTTSGLEVHRRGSAATAIRASVAIPGVLPPVPRDGDLLVDGGVLNNLPFEMMSDDGKIETVVAVNVAPIIGPRAKSDYGLSVSGLRALGAAVTKRGPSYPSVSSVLLRSMLTGAVRNQQIALRDRTVDLLVQLHLPGVGLLDFDRVEEVAEAGYEASLPQVREWIATRPMLRRAALGTTGAPA